MHEQWFSNIEKSSIDEISTANNSKMDVRGIGTLKLCVKNSESLITVEVKDVLFVPDLTANLLSVSRIVSNGNSVKFAEKECRIFDSEGGLLGIAYLENNLYKLSNIVSTSLLAIGNSVMCDIGEWPMSTQVILKRCEKELCVALTIVNRTN